MTPLLSASSELVRAKSCLRLRLARSVAAFCAVQGPRWCGYASQRDYARARAGISWSRFGRLRRVGDFLGACPQAGQLTFSVLDLVSQRLPPEAVDPLLPRLRGSTVAQARALLLVVSEGEASERRARLTLPDGSEVQTVSFAVPAEVARYLHQTLSVAQALIGRDSSDADAVDAVVAEASTELTLDCHPLQARAHFGLLGRPRRRPLPTPPALPPARPCSGRCDRSTAMVLDRWIRRLLLAERHLQIRLEDTILYLHETDAHHHAGYTSLVLFAREVLDLPRSTLYDYLHRARARRRDHPIAVAYACGQLTAVQAQLLERFHRHCHVPSSCLPPWIDVARHHSVRELRRRIEWGRTRCDTDYRAWSNADFRPPTPDEVRTSGHPVHEIAAHPTPEILADVRRQPSTTVRWALRADTLDLLLQLMVASEHARRPDPVPAWWSLLNVFVTARRQWSVLERDPPGYRPQILRRDDYRCVVPECSERRALQVHHLRFRSAGGDDDAANLGTLCAFHHRSLHDGRIRIRGRIRRSPRDLLFEPGIDDHGGARQRFHGERRLGAQASTRSTPRSPACAAPAGSPGPALASHRGGSHPRGPRW